MLVAGSETVIKVLQGHLDKAWALIDAHEPKGKVIRWLRKGGHSSISDWMATEVADLIAQDRRNASVSGSFRLVRATLDGVTHSALENSGRAVMAECGHPCGLATIYSISILETGVPEVDCMACIAARCGR